MGASAYLNVQPNGEERETKDFWGEPAGFKTNPPWQVQLLRRTVCVAVVPYALVLQFYALLVAGLFSVIQLDRTHFLIETVFLALGYLAAGVHFGISVLTGLLLRLHDNGRKSGA